MLWQIYVIPFCSGSIEFIYTKLNGALKFVHFFGLSAYQTHTQTFSFVKKFSKIKIEFLNILARVRVCVKFFKCKKDKKKNEIPVVIWGN